MINLRSILTVATLSLLTITSCVSNNPNSPNSQVPIECRLPSGVGVASITIDNASPIDLNPNGGNPTNISVTATLDGDVPNDGVIYMLCYEVKDSEIIRGQPLAVGAIPFNVNTGSTNTISNSFRLLCDNNNEVAAEAGALSSLAGPEVTNFNRSSGERSTRLRVQHIEGIQSFLGIATGVSGVRSERVRARCPR